MAIEPTAILYDNHNDNSVNGSLWTPTAHQDATVTEVSSSYLYLNAPGTGGGVNDNDRALIIQDVSGGHGFKVLMQYEIGDNFNYVRLGYTDTQVTTLGGNTWSGNYLAVRLGINSNPAPNEATLESSGYSVSTNNSPIAVAENTNTEIKMYEGGDGNIYVYVGSSLLAVVSGSFLSGSFTQYESRSQRSGTRHARLRIYDSYDYPANPIQGGSPIFFP